MGVPPGGADTRLDRLRDLIQIHMAGDDLIIRADHAHQGTLDLFLRQPKRKQQAAVRAPVRRHS